MPCNAMPCHTVGLHCIASLIHTHIHTYTHTYVHTYLPTYVRTYVHTYIHCEWELDHNTATIPMYISLIIPAPRGHDCRSLWLKTPKLQAPVRKEFHAEVATPFVISESTLQQQLTKVQSGKEPPIHNYVYIYISGKHMQNPSLKCSP